MDIKRKSNSERINQKKKQGKINENERLKKINEKPKRKKKREETIVNDKEGTKKNALSKKNVSNQPYIF